jgi:hypothetical protein
MLNKRKIKYYIIINIINNIIKMEEQYIINRRNRRQKYAENKAIENHNKLKRRIEDLRTKNVISSVLKSQRQTRNIDENINDLIDKIKGDNPEFTQENVRTKLQQDYDIRDKKIKIPEFVSETEADDLFDKISKQSISTIYKKARGTSDPVLKERLMQEYRNQNKAIRLAKLAQPSPPPSPPPSAPPSPPIARFIIPKKVKPASVRVRPIVNITRKRRNQPEPEPEPEPEQEPEPEPEPLVASLITQPVVKKPFFNITKKSASTVQPAVILTKEEKKAINAVEKKIKADELLNAKTTAKEEKARLKAEKEANKQPYFGKKKQTGKGFKKINPKYLYSYNTIN